MQKYHSKIVYRLNKRIPVDFNCELIVQAFDMDGAMLVAETEFYHRCPRSIIMTHTCYDYQGEQA